MSETLIIAIITGVVGVLASSGLWAYITHRMELKYQKDEKDNANTRLLLGLAHDRILFLGQSYVHRGYITKEEYDDLTTYLYDPYKDAGGNGSAEKVMSEVNKLPMYKPIYLPKDKHEEYIKNEEVL